MGRTSKAMDTVRRVVDDAMIFASLTVLAWPLLFADLAAHDPDRFSYAVPVGIVVLLSAVVSKVSERWPLAQYAPVSAAVIMAAYRHARAGGTDRPLTWLILTVAGIILIRQFLGARTNAGL